MYIFERRKDAKYLSYYLPKTKANVPQISGPPPKGTYLIIEVEHTQLK